MSKFVTKIRKLASHSRVHKFCPSSRPPVLIDWAVDPCTNTPKGKMDKDRTNRERKSWSLKPLVGEKTRDWKTRKNA